MSQLSAFRELLIKKTDDVELQKHIATVSDEEIIETLEKMATYKRAGASPNASLSHFINDMRSEKEATGEEPSMAASIRDAMGHHAAAYKQAIENNDKQASNKHAQQFIKYGHLTHKISREAPDIMSFDTPDLQPWQSGQPHFASKHKTSGQDCTGWKCHEDMGHNKGDFSWLQNPPHPSRAKEIFSNPHGKDEQGNHQYHDGPYPMEHAKINSKYISLNDSKDIDHPMDKHPIMNVFSHSDSKHGSYEAGKYQQDLANFMTSPHHEKINNEILERAMHPDTGKTLGPTVHDYENSPKLDNPKTDNSFDLDKLIDQHQAESNSDGFDMDKLINQYKQENPEPPKEEPKQQRSMEDIHSDIKKLDSKSPTYVQDIMALTNELKGNK